MGLTWITKFNRHRNDVLEILLRQLSCSQLVGRRMQALQNHCYSIAMKTGEIQMFNTKWFNNAFEHFFGEHREVGGQYCY